MAGFKIRRLNAQQVFERLEDTYSNHFKGKDILVVDGKERTAEWLANYFREAQKPFIEAALQQAAYHKAIKHRDALTPEPFEYAKLALASLDVHWGRDPERLAKVGIPPARKPSRELTAQEKFASAEKAKKTREARGTKGKRQRQAIKGEPVDVISVPRVAKPAAPQPAAPTSTDGANVVVPAPNGSNPVATS